MEYFIMSGFSLFNLCAHNYGELPFYAARSSWVSAYVRVDSLDSSRGVAFGEYFNYKNAPSDGLISGARAYDWYLLPESYLND